MNLNYLVTGGTGLVGSHVVRRLLSTGERVRVITRDAGKAATLPAGAEGVVADLDVPGSLEPAFSGMDTLFLCLAGGPTETAQGLAAVEAAKKAKIGRIVYLSVHMLHQRMSIPLFASKAPVETAVRESGLGWTILRPNHFFQNDLRHKVAMLERESIPNHLE